MKALQQSARSSSLRIIVLGYIVRGPLGGLVWHHLQYVIGLARLGHDVYFVEDSDDYPSCYDPIRSITDTDPTYGLRFTREIFHRIGLGDRWVYYDAHTSRWLGPCAAQILSLCPSADMLLNLSGMNPLRPWFLEIPVRVLVDTDPVFTQIRHLTEPAAHKRAVQHTAFLSFGANFGHSQAAIPNDGLPWQATRQPVTLDAWPVMPGPIDGKFTTIMQWNSYPARQYAGVYYGMKSDAFQPYLDLPAKVGPIFELALGNASAPYALLHSNGWSTRDSREPTRDPWVYQQYIQQSKAEFSVAKHGYVISRSGWFSERSACYLASGRPVLIQETGFSDWLATGDGILPFNSPDQALAGLDKLNSSYQSHCRSARAIAEAYFDARSVLPALIECVMNSYPASAMGPREKLSLLCERPFRDGGTVAWPNT